MITKTKIVMGMPATITLIDRKAKTKDIEEIFAYFKEIDERFSPYKNTSEVTKINREKLKPKEYTIEMKKILKLASKTKKETNGYFDVYHDGKLDTSGIVKGYAIHQASNMLKSRGYSNYYVEIAGDIDVRGKNQNNKKWKVGIKNPFNINEIVKVVYLKNRGIATSGNYIRGNHIYNPLNDSRSNEIASISVIARNVYDADRMATAAFAMGKKGIEFIESLKGFEGYMITQDKQGISTSGFSTYLKN